jgi:hypothetical protein
MRGKVLKSLHKTVFMRLVFGMLTGILLLQIGGIQIIRTALFASSDGHMLLFFDGATIPSGWSCISCAPTDDFYQRFIRGSDQYGATGGSANHTHSYNDSISGSNQAPVSESTGSGTVVSNAHTHTLNTSLGNASNLPSYRQLRVIRHDTNGEPALIPEGAIAIFDSASMPNSDWTQYSTQNNLYIRAEDTVGSTGGSNTHSHNITTTIGTASGGNHRVRGAPTQVSAATTTHSHTASGSTSSVDIQPPYIEAVLGRATTDTTVPVNILTMWDDEQPTGWQLRSDTSDPFYQRFIKPSTSFGSTGGSASHNHTTTTITTSGPTATTNANSDVPVGGASGSHTHTITLENYSTENHLPPYIEVIIAKKQQPASLTQSSYRWYRNVNSTDVGLSLAAQDTSATSIGLPFRLRITISISSENLGVSGESLKLQVAQQVGTCDTSFSGETYSDVSTSSGEIRFYNNAAPDNGDALTPNLNDPDPGSGNSQPQTYIENNPFTNTQGSVTIGDYATWDFALFDHSAPPDTTYCFRVVYAGGNTLNSYSVIPEITTDDGNGNMILLFDGATVPDDWSCISCNPGEPYYQRFARGAPTYGSTGGSETHNHTADGSVNNTTSSAGNNAAGSQVSELNHTHTITPQLSSANHLPPYRQLKYIRYDLSGSPTTLPEGVIALFDDTAPTGWTRYSAQDNLFIRGEASIVGGGSATHTHNLTGTMSTASGGTTTDGGGGGTSSAAAPNHTHTISGTSPSSNHLPPYIDTILAKLDSDAALPAGIITFWDGSPPNSWDNLSETSQPFHHRFVRGATSYGATGGSGTHTHSNHTITSSTPSASLSSRSSGGGADAAHTHNVSISNVSTESNLPPYIDTVIAQQPVPNTPPNAPTALDQYRVTLNNQIALGGYTNETQVEFRASLSDPDDPDSLQLCVEVQPLASSFTNNEQGCGTPVAYSGSPVSGSVIISGLANTQEYHWQARTKDGTGTYSSWVSYGVNTESERDFAIDTIPPSGTVYDGDILGIDQDFNNGSLSTLSANWDIDSGFSGLSDYEYSVGTTPGSTNIQSWQSAGTNTEITASGLNLGTSEAYYVNIRTTDNAGNQSIISSDGQLVAPSLTFSVSLSEISFDTPNSGNNYSVTESIDLETSTNARNGYQIRARATDLLTNQSNQTLIMFDGGSYSSPAEWLSGNTGFGYSSSDTFVNGSNRFQDDPCLGGGSPPCFAPYSTTSEGDIVADNSGPITGAPVLNELFTILNRVSIDTSQSAGTYRTTVIYSILAQY